MFQTDAHDWHYLLAKITAAAVKTAKRQKTLRITAT